MNKYNRFVTVCFLLSLAFFLSCSGDDPAAPTSTPTPTPAQDTTVHFTVTYNGNGNTGGTAPNDASSPYDNGTTVTVLTNSGALLKAGGYTFVVWNTAADGSGTSYAPGEHFSITQDLTLYAQFPANRRIYLTTTYVGAGNWGGVSGADTICGTDSFKPGAGTWKALLVDGTNRKACATASCATSGAAEHVGWVLGAYTPYYKANGTTFLGSTDSLGLLSLSLGASITSGVVPNASTGLNTNWTTSTHTCSSWSSSNNAVSGAAGNTTASDATAIYNSDIVCGTLTALYCVEQ